MLVTLKDSYEDVTEKFPIVDNCFLANIIVRSRSFPNDQLLVCFEHDVCTLIYKS